ncbi:hypothetical protein [Cytobacillus oceanisediminis]|uniref:hypothetical protein n=1 Tax=Cytobacillus oceanisediminis TaxID=665099 RepID=UPI0024956826|nr:hypothetical protein [Cytobacillus oceanisediminis]
METPKKFYESFKKARKFPAGNKAKAKKASGLLKGKNQELKQTSSNGKKKIYVSGTASATQPRRRSCCGR